MEEETKTTTPEPEPVTEPENEKPTYWQVINGEVEPDKTTKRWLNLKQYQNLTPEEKHELHVAGGKARAAQKRERKTFKEDLKTILSSTELVKKLAKNVDDELLKELAQDKNCTVQDLLNAATLLKALSGSERMIEYIRDTIGEAPKLQSEIDLNGQIITAADRRLIDNLLEHEQNAQRKPEE